MKYHIITALVILISLMGCNRDPDTIISDAHVQNVEIHVSETEIDKEQLSLVIAIVRLEFWDGCSSYHDTEYPMANPFGFASEGDLPIWQDGDTIKFKITQSDYVGPEGKALLDMLSNFC